MNSAKSVASKLLREEEGKLLKRHAHKLKKAYSIEMRTPNCGIPAFARWRRCGRYETAAQRDQALRDLRKTAHSSPAFPISEYRVAE